MPLRNAVRDRKAGLRGLRRGRSCDLRHVSSRTTGKRRYHGPVLRALLARSANPDAKGAPMPDLTRLRTAVGAVRRAGSLPRRNH